MTAFMHELLTKVIQYADGLHLRKSCQKGLIRIEKNGELRSELGGVGIDECRLFGFYAVLFGDIVIDQHFGLGALK